MSEDRRLKDKLIRRKEALWQERSSWVSHWQEISTYIMPRNGRFFVTDRNNGARRHNAIYDNTGTRGLRTLAAGMMAGMTSPARPWFRLATPDKELMKSAAVKLWLSDVTKLMLHVFATGNTYNTLHGLYGELGAFGTGVSLYLPDFKTVTHHYPMTCGEYAIATNSKGQVDTLYREFQMRVEELVGEFGLENCTPAVRNMYDKGNLDQWITVIHAIEPRTARDATMKDAKNMAFASVYFEANCTKGQYLRESGFKEFPALAPRWDVTGRDMYGSSPGMEALGDIKQLQHEQLRKANGIDYQTKPHVVAPTAMKNQQNGLLPGGMSFYDGPQTGGVRAAFESTIRLDHLLEDIRDVRERIESTFYADMFLMLASADQTRMTATEVAERHEEKLLMLGPVLERLHNELLNPLIDRTFTAMLAAGVLPPPPQELQGVDLQVEFISMLAQAQRAVATNGIDRFVGNLGAIAAFKPDVLDKFNSDKWADAYADMLGVDPELVVPDKDVALVRDQRAQQQDQLVQAEAARTASEAAANLGTVDTGGKNAASDLMNMFSGYGSPAPQEVV